MRNEDLTFLGCCVLLLVAVLLSALGAYVVMLLWNWLAPIFWGGAPILNFWQTWGVLFLLTFIGNVLFKRGGSNN